MRRRASAGLSFTEQPGFRPPSRSARPGCLDIKVVAGVLGHSSTSITRDVSISEGEWQGNRRLVVIEFADMATLRTWDDSAEYAPALAGKALRHRLLFVEGYDDHGTSPSR
jgi:uncharacterized protein (DUF1330 family)